MPVILIPKAEGQLPAKGQWSPRTVDGKRTAQLACPKCGDSGSLCTHEIAADGTVTPSVMCNACDYHESGLRLEGWEAALPSYASLHPTNPADLWD